jgi:AcrR family transcriptional regulator
MAYNKKTELTKRAIQRAFIQILHNKKFDFITINDIVSVAEINRSSFYRYYEDKYSLVSAIEDDILEHIKWYRDNELKKGNTLSRFSNANIADLLNAMNDFAPIIHELLGPNSDNSFEMRLRNEISKRFFNNQLFPIAETESNQLVKEFLTGIVVQTLKYWTDPTSTLSSEQLAETISKIYLNGFIEALEEK